MKKNNFRSVLYLSMIVLFSSCAKKPVENQVMASPAKGLQMRVSPALLTAPIGQTITLKGANGKFVSSENGAAPMICNRAIAEGWEQFTIIDAGNGKVALMTQSRYVSSQNGEKPLQCSSTSVGTQEQFDWISNTNGTVSFKGNNGKYVSAEGGTQAMTCNRATIGTEESFTVPELSTGAKNPFITNMYTADPSAHVWADGRLYVYASHDIAPPRGCDLMDQYHVFSTADMISWTDHGEILRASDVPWGRKDGGFMWAPDCVYKNGTYYFYFPHPTEGDWGSNWKIGIATSKSPASGFKVQGYIAGLESMIDPAVFIDDDGAAYFYYGGGGVCKGGKLKDNMIEIDGQMSNMEGLADFHEAAWVHKRNGVYYLSYADNHDVGDLHNQMRYATSNSPLGPWQSRGIYMDPTDSYTNHGSIVEFKGQWYAFYHNSSLSNNDWLRSVCADKLYYNADGTIQKVIQTSN